MVRSKAASLRRRRLRDQLEQIRLAEVPPTIPEHAESEVSSDNAEKSIWIL